MGWVAGLALVAPGVPALAQIDGAEADVAYADIIVTARKRAEALKDVPLAVSVLDDRTVFTEGVRGTADVSRLVAGLTFDMGGFLNDTRPAIRGMQAERGRPSLAVLIDGQDLAGENISIAGGGASLNARLFELERVEVVKGPQAVLYGRNAFAGAVNYVTRMPAAEFRARLLAEFAGGGFRSVEGGVDVPILGPRLSVQAGGAFTERDGFYTNPVTDAKVGASRSEGVSVALRVEPVDDVRVVARWIHGKERASEMATAFVGANVRLPAPGARYSPVPGAPATLPCPADPSVLPPPARAQCTRGTFVGELKATERDLDLSPDPLTGQPFAGLDFRQDIVSVNAIWDADWGSLTCRFGFLDNRSHILQDGDYSNFPGPAGLVLALSSLQDLRYDNRTRDHEFRLFRRFGRVDVLLGAQLFSEDSALVNAAQFWLRNPNSPLSGPPFRLATAPDPNFAFPARTTRETRYYGVFASAAVELTRRLRLSGDVRWNYDRIDYDIPGWRLQDVTLQRLRPTCLPQFPNGSTFNPANPGGSPPPGVVVACPRSGTLKSEKLTPRVTLEWRPTPDTLVYGVWAKGFKPGGFNTNEIVELDNQRYLPERVTAWEVGVKTTIPELGLVVNADAYFNDYTNQQIGVQNTNVTPGGQVITTAGIVNAGKVEIWGVEADVEWRPWERLRFLVGYAFTHSDFVAYVQGPPPGSPPALFEQCGVPLGQTSSDQNRAEAGNICADFSGRQVGKSPRHVLNLSGEYRQPIAERLQAFLSLAGRYRSKRFTDESNLVFLPEVWLMELRAGLDWRNVSFLFYVDNLLDTAKIQNAQRNVDFGRPEGFAPGRGFLAYLPQPRTFGVRAGVRF
ncbi:MAG: TonB-dependent receptor [Sphingomonadaceae bacterium]|uniref:TonB-dependent receptor n=1 Tax=Thermaurantiacus sp. TaxID=2820283 RepID=UPI00298EEF2A|nr:TonB-dependent receptor [Thermaurantiacus sp.]MCS6987546.1 TonB-dependent receptor [Sphingomonadaceae bacterium]